MKFGDKYELLESLTTGAVETFVANDKVRGERVLVHILDCAPQRPNQSTMEWVLESFRRVAPEPAGPVLESGKYSGTQYAYLVTKPADEAALKTWVRRYEIQALDTQESVAARSKPVQKTVPVIEPPPVPLPPPPKEPMPAAVSVTQLLRDFDSQSKSPARSAEPIASPQPLPNFSIGGDSGIHSAPPWEPVHAPVRTPPQKDEPLVPRPMEPLSSAYKDKGFVSGSFPASGPPSSSTTHPIKDGKAGEFTSFFQGPFQGDAPSDMPAAVSSQPIEAAPRKKVGDFTAVFGSVGARPDQASPALEESGMNPPPGSFTGMFNDMELPPPTFNTTTPLPPPPNVLTQKPIEPAAASVGAKKEVIPPPVFVAPPPPPLIPQAPPIVPIPPVPNVASEKPSVAKPSTLPGDGATGAFSNPAAREPAPVFQEAPAGPSPYTQIISRDKLMGASTEGEEEEETAGFPSAPKFGAPKAPGIKPPKMAPMKMPPPPPKPKVAAPAAPKAPKMPKLEAPAQPPVTPWPVIITLIVLFFLAVLLVMYFWLKNH